VLAGPGGGKSSLLRACTAAAVDRWRQGATDAAIPVPVHAVELVRANLYQAAAQALSAELRRFGLTSMLTADFFTQPPDPSRRWVFLVDGVDEITSAANRRELLSELRTIARDGHPMTRFVVATRPLEAGDLDLLGPGVT
jgi:hypothetical protein